MCNAFNMKKHWGYFLGWYIFFILFYIYYINEFGPYRPLLRQINKRTPLSPSPRLLHLWVSPSSLMDLNGSKTDRCENSQSNDHIARTINFRNLKTLPKIPHLKERDKDMNWFMLNILGLMKKDINYMTCWIINQINSCICREQSNS